MWEWLEKQSNKGPVEPPEMPPLASMIKEALDPIQTEIVALRAIQRDLKTEAAALLAEYEKFRKECILGIAEGVEKVERAERRTKATIQRARKELAASGFESPALDAEADDLRPLDGTGSDERGMQPVREEVESVDPTPSSIRNVTLEQLQNIRARRW